MRNKRSDYEHSYNLLETSIEFLALFLCVVPLVYLWTNWGGLPEFISSDLKFTGTISGRNPKGSLVIMQVIVIFLYVLLSVVDRRPEYFNHIVKITPKNARSQYSSATLFIKVLKLEIIGMFGLLSIILVNSGKTGFTQISPQRVTLFFMGLIFFTIITFISLQLKRR